MCASVCPSLCPSEGHHRLSKFSPAPCYVVSPLVGALVFALDDALAACSHVFKSPFLREQKGDFIKFWTETKLQTVDLLIKVNDRSPQRRWGYLQFRRRRKNCQRKRWRITILWKQENIMGKSQRRLDRTKCGTGQSETADRQWWWEKTRQGYAD